MLSVEAVPVRHLLLGLLAATLLVAGVYLFHEVRTSPAVAAAPPQHNAAVDREATPPAAELQAKTAPVDRHGPLATMREGSTAAPPAPAIASESPSDEDLANLDKPNVKLDSYMDQANKAYDKGDWEEAKLIAGKVLAKQATNIRMMRIMVSASCIDGDSTVAQRWFDQLPKLDREQMKVRCDKYGVSFKETAQ
jgi:hypothetical protein